MSKIGESDHPTVGQHFNSLLLCPQRAWLDYHGDRSARAKPSSYLSKLQQEGLEHERRICEQCYPNAVRISDTGADEERAALTIKAMRAGTRDILQPYFMREGGRGIADIISLVGPSSISPVGFQYRVGELKLARALTTSHVMQVAWYHELLKEIQGDGVDEAFFILGDMRYQTVSMKDVYSTFEKCKHQLLTLRGDDVGPKAHLCQWCKSCPWRQVCLPELTARSDVSLLPGVSRRVARNLKQAGIETWQQVVLLENSQLEQFGFDWRELAHIRDSGNKLKNGHAVLRCSIKPNEIRSLRAMSIEFVDGYRGADGHPLPHTICIESANGPESIPVADNGNWFSRISESVMANGVALYGATETVAFLKLMRDDDRPRVKCVDILDLVDTIVHAPIRGLDLVSLLHVAEPRFESPQSTRDRVLGLRSVINWLAGSGDCAA